MTKLEHFNDSARAVARSEWMSAQSGEIFERAQQAIEETRALLAQIGRPVDAEVKE